MDPPLTKCIIKLRAEFEKHWLGWDALAWDNWCWWTVPSHTPSLPSVPPSALALSPFSLGPLMPARLCHVSPINLTQPLPFTLPLYSVSLGIRITPGVPLTISLTGEASLKPYTWFQRDRCDRIGGEKDKRMTSHASLYNKAIHGKRSKLCTVPQANNGIRFPLIRFYKAS